MIDILIIIDNPYREFLNLNLLKKLFSNKNLSTRIVSKHLYEDAIIKYKPQAVITPRLTQGFKKIFDLSNKFNFKIYLLPCEHGGGEKQRIISFLVGYENKDNYNLDNFKHYKNIKKIFAPSEKYKNYCIESGLFLEDQIIITGTISSDFWFKKISNSINNENRNISIGIASSFKSTFFGIHFNSFLDGLLFTKDLADQNRFKDSTEKNIFFHSFEVLSFLNLLKIIDENPDIKFSWRLHPQENIKGAKYLAKKIKNLEINRDIIPYQWIKNQSLIMVNTSTMIYDSYFLKTPVISLIDLIPNNVKDNLEETKKPLKSNHIHNPNSINDVIEIIKKKNFENSIHINDEDVLKESFNNFNFPRNNFAVVTIFNEISDNIKVQKKVFFFKIILNIFIDLLVNLKMIKAAYSSSHKDIQLDKVLNPFNLKDKLKINRFINNIINKII